MASVTGTVDWFFSQDENGWYTAWCDQLRITASGESYDAMLDDLKGAQEDLLSYLKDKAEVASYITETGLSLVPDTSADVRWDINLRIQPEPTS